MRILHLSADYPDPLQPAKTRAVANLLALADGHRHRVLSLNRVGGRPGWACLWQGEQDIHALDFADAAGEGHRAVAYPAPPKGLMLRRTMERLADWAAEDCAAAGFVPDLVHAHKLSVEGVAGARLAERLAVPLALSVQGNTDLKIVGARRDLRPLYARIWRDAAVAFPFAPWARAGLDALLGARAGRTVALPCPVPADALTPPQVTSGSAPAPVIRTAFNLKDAANKNAGRLIRAIARAGSEVPEIRLEIIGGGDPAAFAALAELAEREAPRRVRFLGPVPNAQVQHLFNAAAAFALVSHRETYGMVFAEALLAGAPCLFPRGRAIDGYFAEGSVVLAADPEDEAEIASCLVRLVREEDAFKDRLDALGRAGGLALLTRPAIRDSYLDALAETTR